MNWLLLLPIPFGIITSYTDLKTREIRYKETYPLIILGLIINTYLNGLRGLEHSLLALVTALIMFKLFPVFERVGGGDFKVSMGYATFIGSQGYIIYFVTFVALLSLINISRMIKAEGFKIFKNNLLLEIKTGGAYRTRFESVPGGPILFSAYLITVFCFM